MQIGYRKYGQSGMELTDWWPNVGSVIDEVALIRSMYTTDNAPNNTVTGQWNWMVQPKDCLLIT